MRGHDCTGEDRCRRPLDRAHPVDVERRVLQRAYRLDPRHALRASPVARGARHPQHRLPQERPPHRLRHPRRALVPRAARLAGRLAVAGIDEWHQSFVPSRGASVYDVLLDTVGALMANVIIRFMVKRTSLVVLSLLVCLPLWADTQQVLSQTYTIDKKYRSMEGPNSVITVHLGDQDKPEVVWLTGIKTEVVGEDGSAAAPQEMMCHLNVEIDAMKHKALFALKRMPSSRLMTLSQGVFEMKLPEGFGFPIASTEPLYLYTQVLNLNIDDPKNMKVRHRVTFTYVRDAALKQPMVALFNAGASGLVRLDDHLAMAM